MKSRMRLWLIVGFVSVDFAPLQGSLPLTDGFLLPFFLLLLLLLLILLLLLAHPQKVGFEDVEGGPLHFGFSAFAMSFDSTQTNT